MVYDTKIITDYTELLNKVVNLFTSKQLKQKQYADAISMNKVTFKKRIDSKSFSPDELLKLIDEINKGFK